MAYRSTAFIASLCSVLLAASSGCFFYSDDDGCDYGGSATGGGAVYDPGQRNPETGECVYFGGGGGGTCADPCTPCAVPAAEEADRAPAPTWGYCESHCTGLDENTCIDTSGCRAIYVGSAYRDCWSTDQTGPIQGGGCEGLDAYACSLHDDCSAVHSPAAPFGDAEEPGFAAAIGAFESCIPEKGQCERNPESCAGGPGSCEGEAICPMAPPACPEGTSPGIAGGCYTGYCIPLADCGDGDPDPGLCYAPVTSGQVPPACPEGTTPGIAGGYYTGYCIPLAQCEAQAACSEIQAEATCIAREDCTPLYEGVDCLCTGDSCTCADWVYTSCN